MTNDIAFKTINALSCHNIPTTNQPIKPRLAMYKFKGNIFTEVNNMATINVKLLAHFIYQDKSPLGVVNFTKFDHKNNKISAVLYSTYQNVKVRYQHS